MSTKNYIRYCEYLQKIAHYQGISALLHWDQEVNMPSGGAEYRAKYIAELSTHIHSLTTSDEIFNIVKDCENEIDTYDAAQANNIALTKKDLEKNRKLPSELIEKLSLAGSNGYFAWQKAKNTEYYSDFEPALQTLVNLNKEKIERIGYESHKYDVLLDEYDRGVKTEILSSLFDELKPELTKIINRYRQNNIEYKDVNPVYTGQNELNTCLDMAKLLGYTPENGRLDLSAHPFSTTIAPRDSRITTRISKDNYLDCIWSTLHEVGHAKYELGLPVSEYGLPSGTATSTSIHESQSRFWENVIGRSRNFIQATLSTLQVEATANEVFNHLNYINPNFIRTSSDEVTYHYHIILRYEIERALFDESLSAADIPELWNAKVKDYLGLTVNKPTQGILQDIHWAEGLFGYFPTYSLGSIYSAQFYDAMIQNIPKIEQKISVLDFTEINNWLSENIFKYGQTLNSEELCENATGKKLHLEPFIRYLNQKLFN
ncbi:MAG: carboxypeptidase M32 [Bacteroidota bacterium]|nr:carboxypeptidase M32 [Bacteroidota bacterium]